MAKNKPINTAGVFALGQSHKDNFFDKQSYQQNMTSESSSFDELSFDLNDPENKDMLNDEMAVMENEEKNSKFEQNLSFIGRLFNFNIWNRVMTSKEIQMLFNDCKLIFCGNAVQWSDFRQGTRGQVKMIWRTELLWQSKIRFLYTQ